MATTTSTIRVSRETRDILAEQARERGMSLAAFVGQLAREGQRDSMWRSERGVAAADARKADARSELEEWEDTLGDGLA